MDFIPDKVIAQKGYAFAKEVKSVTKEENFVSLWESKGNDLIGGHYLSKIKGFYVFGSIGGLLFLRLAGDLVDGIKLFNEFVASIKA